MDREAHRILELARVARTPSAADKAAVERRVAAALALSAAAAGSAAPAHAAGAGNAVHSAAPAALKLGIAGFALVVGAAALVSYLGSSRPSVGHAPERVARPSASAGARLEPPHVAAPAAQVSVERPAAAAPAVERVHAATHAPRAAGHGSTSEPELDLLHRAQAAWRGGAAAEALSLLEQHRAQYPGSALALERDALRALCLCDLGRRAEATRLAHAVIARAPHSPLRATLEQSCAR